MKSPLLVVAALLITVFLNAQIPNGSFENWTLGPHFDVPVVAPSNFVSANDQTFWFVGLTPVTEVAGVEGSAMRMETLEIEGEPQGAFALWGSTPDDSEELIFSGGFPFSDIDPAGIQFDARYDIEGLSPGFMVVQFKADGVPVTGGPEDSGTYIFAIAGDQPDWELHEFDFFPPINQTPDSCVIGFTSNDLLTEPQVAFAGNFLEVDNIAFVGSEGVVPGGDLNNWEPGPAVMSPDDWVGVSIPGIPFVEMSENAFDGLLSMQLNTLEDPDSGGNFGIASAFLGNVANEDIIANQPLPNGAFALNYQYEYVPEAMDSALVIIVLSETLNNDPDELYFDWEVIYSTDGWTSGNIDFSDALDFYDPEYYAIAIFSGYVFEEDSQPQGLSSLWVDAMEFSIEESMCVFDATIPEGDVTLCPGESAMISTQMYDAYQWYSIDEFGNEMLIDGATDQSFEVTDDYIGMELMCEVTLEACTEFSDDIWVYGHDYDAPVVITQDVTLCEGDSLILEAEGDLTNYQWWNEDQLITGANDLVLVTYDAGLYYITGEPEVCPGVEVSSNVVSLDIQATPMPIIIQTDNTLSTENSWDVYQWYLDDELIAGASNEDFVITEDGDYSVFVWDEFGCGGLSDVFGGVYVGISDLEQKAISFYPNPVQETLFINNANSNTFKAEIFNLAGELVLSAYSSNAGLSMDVNDLAGGVYFIRVNDGNEPYTQRIVKL